MVTLGFAIYRKIVGRVGGPPFNAGGGALEREHSGATTLCSAGHRRIVFEISSVPFVAGARGVVCQVVSRVSFGGSLAPILTHSPILRWFVPKSGCEDCGPGVDLLHARFPSKQSHFATTLRRVLTNGSSANTGLSAVQME
jgi:hypothetical protein